MCISVPGKIIAIWLLVPLLWIPLSVIYFIKVAVAHARSMNKKKHLTGLAVLNRHLNWPLVTYGHIRKD